VVHGERTAAPVMKMERRPLAVALAVASSGVIVWPSVV